MISLRAIVVRPTTALTFYIISMFSEEDNSYSDRLHGKMKKC